MEVKVAPSCPTTCDPLTPKRRSEALTWCAGRGGRSRGGCLAGSRLWRRGTSGPHFPMPYTSLGQTLKEVYA